MASKRKTPELKLNEEEPLVLSRDFNLFYRPQEKPLPAGTENFIKSLDNFITGAGTSMVIASEYKQKKEEGAKAIKDYAELKTKFRKAVKEGKIKKEANPYYLEKYQQLSLNSYASEFSDILYSAYVNEKVGDEEDAKNTSLAIRVNVLFIGNFSFIPADVHNFSFIVAVSISIDNSGVISCRKGKLIT